MYDHSSIDLTPLTEFLQAPTPQAWVLAANEHLQCLLIDHAHCERKAANTALTLLSRYPKHPELLQKLSKLAREELLHFEKVLAILKQRKITYFGLKPSRYAKELHSLCRSEEPFRLIDSLIIGAIIEARSCERFAALIPTLDEELASFYHSLLKSEARHFKDYLTLAARYSSAKEVETRSQLFLTKEKELILSSDPLFRFHSGIPQC